jgi:hypothetical protein
MRLMALLTGAGPVWCEGRATASFPGSAKVDPIPKVSTAAAAKATLFIMIGLLRLRRRDCRLCDIARGSLPATYAVCVAQAQTRAFSQPWNGVW